MFVFDKGMLDVGDVVEEQGDEKGDEGGGVVDDEGEDEGVEADVVEQGFEPPLQGGEEGADEE